ncbi:MAG: YggS family pyridoxal phosphate-dependent enzyme [Calditrichota bacterium]
MDADLVRNYDVITRQIQDACRNAHRSPDEISLIAITKTFPSSMISKAYALGIRHVGENRVQEIIDKYKDGMLKKGRADLYLHLVGHLQSNKVRKAVQYADSVDSLDSTELATAIQQAASDLNKRIRVLLEVNTSGEPQKYGIHVSEAMARAETILKLKNLSLAGLMTIGPNVTDESSIRRSFAEARECFENVKRELNPPDWSALSMGMSGDFPIAIEEGATEIRLGTALFGARSYS